jgi:predicted negative regulator of RcsB-dependent stress response
MPKPATPSGSKPTADDRNLVVVDENYAAPGLEDNLRIFWEKHSKTVVAAIALVALVYVGQAVWKHEKAEQEIEISNAFGAAKTDGALKSFIAENPSHPLAGEAQLRLADNAYKAGNFGEAQAAYEKAQTLLTADPISLLEPRAELGAAVSSIAAGHDAEGAAALKRLADNPARPKGIRGEAAYDLAALAAEAGRAAELDQLIDQIDHIDPNGMWARTAADLKARLASSGSTPLSTPAANDKPTGSSGLPVIKPISPGS